MFFDYIDQQKWYVKKHPAKSMFQQAINTLQEDIFWTIRHCEKHNFRACVLFSGLNPLMSLTIPVLTDSGSRM